MATSTPSSWVHFPGCLLSGWSVPAAWKKWLEGNGPCWRGSGGPLFFCWVSLFPPIPVNPMDSAFSNGTAIPWAAITCVESECPVPGHAGHHPHLLPLFPSRAAMSLCLTMGDEPKFSSFSRLPKGFKVFLWGDARHAFAFFLITSERIPWQ